MTPAIRNARKKRGVDCLLIYCRVSREEEGCLDGVFSGPLACCSLIAAAVGLVNVCNFGDERVIGVRIGEHRADGEEDFSYY